LVGVEIGQNPLGGLESGVCEVNNAKRIAGRPRELFVRDAAADLWRAAAAADELAFLA